MLISRRVPLSAALVSSTKPLAGALATALLMYSTAHAAGFGHSRIVSALGQPLRIDVPVTQLSADDLRSISVSPAPAQAWVQAGLTPPVDLGSLQTRLADGFAAGSKVIQVRSNQPFDKPVADLLLDVRTASGQQRYQVSLLTHASQNAIRAAGASSPGTPAAGGAGGMAGGRVSQDAIQVRRNDTMFAIAGRHAVPGVTVYQMMIALQRANPQAFIEENVNLVKAGATLAVPDMAGLTAISDSEARRIFQQQAQAFALYRQRAAGQASAIGHDGAGASGVVSPGDAPNAPQSAAGPRDQLRLSGGASANKDGTDAGSGQSDDQLATHKGIKDSEGRVSQLEENVKHLNQALQSQGKAANDLLVDGAKGLGLSLPGGASGAAAGGTSPAAGSGEAGAADAVSANDSAPGAADAASAGKQPGSATAGGGQAAAPTAGASGAPGAADNTANKANKAANDASPSSADKADGVAQPISSKAEQTVSWIQEHMLGVITGVLALIVLIIAWILRRANAARDDDDHGSLITEAMVKEKLDLISLDLDQPPPDDLKARKR